MASESESDVQEPVDWGRKWLVDFNAGETQLVSFDWSNNTGAINAVFLAHYFTSAKKCLHKSCMIDFTSAKVEFTLAIFKKLYFSKD